MYGRISVLQDTKMKNMENVIKVHNQTKRNADPKQAMERRPTYLVNLGLKRMGTWPRPNNQLTRERWLGEGLARGRPHLGGSHLPSAPPSHLLPLGGSWALLDGGLG